MSELNDSDPSNVKEFQKKILELYFSSGSKRIVLERYIQLNDMNKGLILFSFVPKMFRDMIKSDKPFTVEYHSLENIMEGEEDKSIINMCKTYKEIRIKSTEHCLFMFEYPIMEEFPKYNRVLLLSLNLEAIDVKDITADIMKENNAEEFKKDSSECDEEMKEDSQSSAAQLRKKMKNKKKRDRKKH